MKHIKGNAIDHLLEMTNTYERTHGGCASFNEITFVWNGAKSFFSTADGITIKRSSSYNHVTNETRYSYKFNFVAIDNHHETIVGRFDELTADQRQCASDALFGTFVSMCKNGKCTYFELKNK